MAIRLPSAWKDELLARTDIVSVVSGYVSLKKDGRRYWGLCPFHNEKTPSFSVNPDLNMYYCFGCKATGDAIRFVMEMERAPFMEAVKILADRAHMALPELQEDPDYERRRSQRERLLNANRDAARYYHDTLWKPEGKAVLDYLHHRGLTDGVIRRFGLGASTNEWDDLTKFLIENGYSQEELVLAGLTVVRNDNVFDMFRGRAMFPIIDQYNRVLGFGGRALQKDLKPKYMNTTDTPVFNKRKGVYAINLIRKSRDLKRVILVEGYMDVVAISQAGVTGAVATLGTALTNEQARLLGRYAPEVYLCYDGDEAGQHAIERGLDILEAEGVPCRVIYLPDGLDPDEFIRQRGLAAFEAIRPMLPTAYRMQRLQLQFDLQTQEGKTEYAKKCAELLRRVKDPVDLENYLKDLTVQTGFSRDVLLAQIGPRTQGSGASANALLPFRDKPVRERTPRQPDNYRIEQTLLSLLAAGRLKEGTVKETDFDSETLRLIAGRLIAGETPDSIVSNEDLTDDVRQAAGEAFSRMTGAEEDNAAAVAGDCLRKIQIRRLKQETDRLTKAAIEADSAEKKNQLLTEIQQINKEMEQLKQQGR